MKYSSVLCIILSFGIFSAAAQWNQNGSTIYYNTGNIGIGTETPQARVHIAGGNLLLQNTGSGYPALYLKNVAGDNTLKLDYNSIIHSGGHLLIRSGESENLLLNDTGGGNVGVGTANPKQKLTVAGQGLFLEDSASPDPGDGSGRALRLGFSSTGYGYINANNTGVWPHNLILQQNGGGVGIGTVNVGAYRLAVEGKIGAREINVNVDTWPDYVFEENYDLPLLTELEAYIQNNQHLPGIPSAQDVKEHGVDLGEMNALLLKKIEELTLYLIEQDNQMRQLKEQINTIKANGID